MARRRRAPGYFHIPAPPASAHDGVTRAALLRLQDKLHAKLFYGSTHVIRLMADDHVNVTGRHDLPRCLDHMSQQWLAANLMQHFGAAGLKTRAFAGRHNDDGEAA